MTVILQTVPLALSVKTVLRYMGCRNTDSPELTAMAEDAIDAIVHCCAGKACWLRVPVQISGSRVNLQAMEVESRNLAVNLEGCREAFFFAATVGMEVERQIAVQSKLAPARALALDAAGSAAVEAWANEANRRLKAEVAAEGRFLRPRFSPGYGDFSIAHQPEFLTILDLPRKLGVSLTSGGMMLPTKSITAVIGISDRPAACRHTGCAACEKEDCPYRA